MTNEELLAEIERCATSLLTDEEICDSLEITPELLAEHYNIVIRARVRLKQRLNGLRISNAAKGDTSSNTAISDLIKSIPQNRQPTNVTKYWELK